MSQTMAGERKDPKEVTVSLTVKLKPQNKKQREGGERKDVVLGFGMWCLKQKRKKRGEAHSH